MDNDKSHAGIDVNVNAELGAADTSKEPLAVELAADNPFGEDPFPEGGLQAWLVVLGAWLALFPSLGLMNSIATLQTYLSEHQLADKSEGTIGWIFSVYAFAVFFSGVYIGPVFDKYGPRWLVLSGTILFTISLILLSFCKVLWQFILAFGLLGGLGMSLLFTPSIACVGHFFMERRGFATGVASTAGGLGGICIPLMLQSLFSSIGWAWSIRALALLAFVCAATANLLLRTRLPPAQDASAHPDPRIFRSLPFSLTVAGIFLLEFALFVPLTYISSYATSRGFSTSFASQVLTVLNACSVVGRVLPGWYADKMGPFNSSLIGVFMAIVSCLGVWLPASVINACSTGPDEGGDHKGSAVVPLIIFALMFGIASGCNICLVPVCIGRLCATVHYGRYYATCYTVVSVATLIGIPIAGTVLAANDGSYWGLIVLTAAIYAGSLLALWAAKISVVGWKLSAKY